jgi:hypothetical protein
MTERDEDQLREIWRRQPIAVMQMTPDQLRARAEQFESQIRRRNLRDYLAFGFVVIGFSIFSIFLHGTLLRLGSVLTIIWALYSMFGLHRFGSAISASTVSDAQACASFHQRQLERQRDIALSWPWGIGLALPGFILVSVGLPFRVNPPDWTIPIALIGAFVFMYVALVIYGKTLARQWQREIDSLELLMKETN